MYVYIYLFIYEYIIFYIYIYIYIIVFIFYKHQTFSRKEYRNRGEFILQKLCL